jgi:hypothetical protein
MTPYIPAAIGLVVLPYEALVAWSKAVQMGIRDKLTLNARAVFKLLQQVNIPHGKHVYKVHSMNIIPNRLATEE